MSTLLAPLVSGLADVVGDLLVIAGTLLLVLMFVALGSYAYKQLRGDGIEWPDDDPEAADDEVTRGSDDDEWKYY